jgi:hypothetical protein
VGTGCFSRLASLGLRASSKAWGRGAAGGDLTKKKKARMFSWETIPNLVSGRLRAFFATSTFVWTTYEGCADKLVSKVGSICI